MPEYIYQTVAVTTDEADDSVIKSVSAAGAFVASAVTSRKPKPGTVGNSATPVEPGERKPFRFTPERCTHIARFLVSDAALLTRWAGTPDPSERLALLLDSGIAPKYNASPLTPTVSEAAVMRSVGRATATALWATGGFVRSTDRGAKSAATAGDKRAQSAEAKTAAVLDSMFADADADAPEPRAAAKGR